MKTLRCAIYTRKSSEEGLEQGFNSLDAQREACAAYILSQAGEGWVPVGATYDDGGFSGGSMARPGLEALMADVRDGRVDVVVVYKVDRLTRSLADFARIVELFDQKGVSFVSVTQAFNTTTSMGRLTLNVLLSFAQFEREVTGERIRDKIAASKRKGLWMGGRPPLGYDGVERKLVVNDEEAQTVRHIFGRYLELQAVSLLSEQLAADGVHAKRWVNRKGQLVGGGRLGRGALYHLLSNPVYVGAIRHGKQTYPDAHTAIVETAVWDQVQSLLRSNGIDRPGAPTLKADVLLDGILYDPRGEGMAPSYAVRRGRRYRYYIARSLRHRSAAPRLRMSRVAMGVVDDFVRAETLRRLREDFLPDAVPDVRTKAAVARVDLTEESVTLWLKRETVRSELAGGRADEGELVKVRVEVILKHRQGAMIIEAPNGQPAAGRIDRALARAVALARNWADRLASGETDSLKALAKAEGYCEHHASRLLPLAWLAPDLVEMIVRGKQPRALSLKGLTQESLPLSWSEQRKLVARFGTANPS